MSLNKKPLWLSLSGLCLFFLGSAYALEWHYHLIPCSLCLLQRLCLLLIALGTFFHAWRWSLLWSLIGSILAGRQIWLQHQTIGPPPDACSPGLTYLYQQGAWGDLLSALLHSSTSCSTIDFRLFSWSLASWALLLFGLLGLATTWLHRAR